MEVKEPHLHLNIEEILKLIKRGLGVINFDEVRLQKLTELPNLKNQQIKFYRNKNCIYREKSRHLGKDL